jgi:hypothetical protein
MDAYLAPWPVRPTRPNFSRQTATRNAANKFGHSEVRAAFLGAAGVGWQEAQDVTSAKRRLQATLQVQHTLVENDFHVFGQRLARSIEQQFIASVSVSEMREEIHDTRTWRD